MIGKTATELLQERHPCLLDLDLIHIGARALAEAGLGEATLDCVWTTRAATYWTTVDDNLVRADSSGGIIQSCVTVDVGDFIWLLPGD